MDENEEQKNSQCIKDAVIVLVSIAPHTHRICLLTAKAYSMHRPTHRIGLLIA